MPIALVGSAQASAYSTGVTVSRATTAGSLLVLTVGHSGTAAPTVTDSGGGTWQLVGTTSGLGGNADTYCSIYYRLNAPAITSVTVGGASGNKAFNAVLSEYSGADSFRAGGTALITSGTAIKTVNAQAGDLVVGMAHFYQATRSDQLQAGFTALPSSDVSTTHLAAAYSVLGTSGAVGPQWNGITGSIGMVTAAFAPPAPPASTVKAKSLTANAGGFTASTGTDLAAVVADGADGTYVESPATPANAAITWRLAPLTAPPATVTVRALYVTAAATVKIELLQGATVIASTTAAALTTSAADYTLTLTSGQQSAIAVAGDGSVSNLDVRVTGNQT